MTNDNLKKKKLFLLDMDGTIYLDNTLFKYSFEFLNYIKSINGKYIFLTNNSSKSVNDYIDKLTKLSIEVDSSNFMTSSQATSLLLRQRYNNKKIYVLGTKSLKTELKEDGLDIVDEFFEEIDCLLVGFDTELKYLKLNDACRILTKDVIYLATNPDLICPTSFGFIPDCGSICNMIETATGKIPEYIGKPKPEMVELAIEINGFSKEETIVIGDRLYTDIACGINAGVSTCIVLTGETKSEHLINTEFVPDYVFKDIGELYLNLINN
ncbi:HAD-IIA family hydrolase [Sedimentibacter sp.]|uniref:HAD-IIA family hydrolase n=1 Tax=Sedimentibacter sp. TaxID=1960295 RepID=UPI0028AD0744|nr:HAD-IIA family hydrolase [Sedimentibacter sp.]